MTLIAKPGQPYRVTDTPLRPANYRPITDEDRMSAARGLKMRIMSDPQLHRLIEVHGPVDTFASAVIVAAAEQLLAERRALRAMA